MVLVGQIISLSLTSGFPGTTEANHTASRGALVVSTTAPRGEGGGEAFYLLLTCYVILKCAVTLVDFGEPENTHQEHAPRKNKKWT